MPQRAGITRTGGLGRAVLCALLTATSSGCASWHETDLSPQQVMRTERPPRVRVTTEDGAQTVLERPRVLGDVLAGFDNQCIEEFGRQSNQCPEVGIAVFDISLFEVQRRGPAQIFLPAIGALTLVAVFLFK